MATFKVPHLGKELVFVYSVKGPGTYASVQKQILKDNLIPPTATEIVSLIHTALQKPRRKCSKEIKKLLEEKYLWTSTGNLYIPKKGVYIQDNPKIRNKRVVMEEPDLEKRLDIRFVPFDYKTGSQSVQDLEENPFILALVGEEGARKLAEISNKYKNNPFVGALGLFDTKPATKIITIRSSFSGDSRLVIDRFSDTRDYKFGCSFGIKQTA